MGYLAIARKWRPARFEELVGQHHVAQTLKNAVLFKKVAHAYLFSGARGVGKTSVARIFAKVLRCPNVKEASCCNTCSECVAIAEGKSVDVLEIDGASNNGVESVRVIRENVSYGAATGYYKIYIIDEVHMLSISAFNALLKTLEEPPAHVVFIFATTEASKIPLTILSRCQRFEFRRLSSQQIVTRLEHILNDEKLSIDHEGLYLIAEHSDGSLRDALSLLDQTLSYYQSESYEKLSPQQIAEALGISEAKTTLDFLQFIIHGETKNLLDLIERLYASGIDLKHFAEGSLDDLRLLYLFALSNENDNLLSPESHEISPEHGKRLNELSKDVSVIELERMAQILGKTIQQMAVSHLPRFVLEMASIRMAKLKGLDKMMSMAQPSMEVVADTTIKKELPASPQAVPPPTSKPSPPPPPAPFPMPRPHYQNPDDEWKAFVDSVMKRRPILGALLHHANYKIERQNSSKMIEIGFELGSFYERQALDTQNRKDLESFVKMFFGNDSQLLISNLSEREKNSLVKKQQEEVDTLKKMAIEHPTVIKAKEILGADIVDVRMES